MENLPSGERHFARAATQLGDRKTVVTTQAIFSAQGAKVINKGASVDKTLYSRLTQHRLSAPLAESLACNDAVTGASLRQTAEDMLRDIPFFARLAMEPEARKVLLGALESIPLSEAIAFQLAVARDVQPELYLHLVRTSLISAWLACASPQVSRFDLGMAAAAGVLHDIGMLHVDPLLLQPTEQLNRDQRRQLYAHPLVSSALLERHHHYIPDVVRAVGEHQEYMDGSGYPRNLSGDAISPLGKIVSLAQAVSAMFAQARGSPEMRVSILLRMTTDLYESAMAGRMLNLLRPGTDGLPVDRAQLDKPIELLREVGDILERLPTVFGSDDLLSDMRRRGVILVADHAARIQRVLARVGVMPDHLAQLAEDAADDGATMTELELLTIEASWQLRTLARHVRRRWKVQQGEQFPEALQRWLDEVDGVVLRSSGGP